MATAITAAAMHSRVEDFLQKPRQMFINNQFVNSASGKTFPTYNPATGEVLAGSKGGAESLRGRRVGLYVSLAARTSDLEAR